MPSFSNHEITHSSVERYDTIRNEIVDLWSSSNKLIMIRWSKIMNIYQIVPSLSYGDAIGNEAIAISEVIQDMGYQTKIYASYIDPRISEGVD